MYSLFTTQNERSACVIQTLKEASYLWVTIPNQLALTYACLRQICYFLITTRQVLELLEFPLKLIWKKKLLPHKQTKSKEFGTQTRLGGEISKSDIIM